MHMQGTEAPTVLWTKPRNPKPYNSINPKTLNPEPLTPKLLAPKTLIPASARHLHGTRMLNEM